MRNRIVSNGERKRFMGKGELPRCQVARCHGAGVKVHSREKTAQMVAQHSRGWHAGIK